MHTVAIGYNSVLRDFFYKSLFYENFKEIYKIFLNCEINL